MENGIVLEHMSAESQTDPAQEESDLLACAPPRYPGGNTLLCCDSGTISSSELKNMGVSLLHPMLKLLQCC